MTKRDIFVELIEGFEALKSGREGKLTRPLCLTAESDPAPVVELSRSVEYDADYDYKNQRQR